MDGFKGAIDIEGWHDPVYRGDLEMTGQVHGLNYLKWCRGGEFVTNPEVDDSANACTFSGFEKEPAFAQGRLLLFRLKLRTFS